MQAHNNMEQGDIPLGIGMALAQNMQAMYAFTALDESTREAFIHNAQAIQTKEEMQAYVNHLLES